MFMQRHNVIARCAKSRHTPVPSRRPCAAVRVARALV